MPCQLTFPQNYNSFHWSFILFSIDFPEHHKSKFPIETHYFLQSGKRVQQTMVLDSPKGCPIYFISGFRWIFIVFINDSLSWPLDSKKISFPIEKPYFFAKWKTRSANYGFRQSKCPVHLFSSEFCSIFICIYMVCWTRFPRCGK